VRVQGINDAVAIAAGRDMSYAVRANGTLWAWGLNGDGQLGDGTTANRTTPVRVGNLTDVVDVAGGRDHGLAVLGNGQVWAWGWNRYAQVGDGTTVDRTNPVRVTGIAAATSVIGGAHHSFALLENGQVWSWGRNYRAQLGDGTTTQRSRPVRVGSLTDVVAIGSGRDHGLAVLANGTVRAWGNNQAGQLGDGTLTRRPNPVTVSGLAEAEVVGGGSDYSVALVGTGGTPPPPPPPGNQPPNAVIGAGCSGLACSFTSAASNDPDGSIVSRSWTFGDGSSSGGASPNHTYAGPGTYSVTVTVTDDDGASDSASTSVTVSEPSGAAPAFRAGASSNANTTTARVAVPGSVTNGDLLLLFVATNRNTSASTPNGWTLRDTQVDGSIASRLYTRTVVAGVAGSTVSVSLGERAKTDMSLVAYRDASFGAWSVAPETGSSSSHTTPSVAVGAADSVVVSHWVDKTSNATAWSLPGNVVQRLVSNGTGGGRINSATGDTAVGGGNWPGATAVAANPANKAVMWSVVVAPG
jgi:PKD repeat protein